MHCFPWSGGLRLETVSAPIISVAIPRWLVCYKNKAAAFTNIARVVLQYVSNTVLFCVHQSATAATTKWGSGVLSDSLLANKVLVGITPALCRHQLIQMTSAVIKCDLQALSWETECGTRTGAVQMRFANKLLLTCCLLLYYCPARMHPVWQTLARQCHNRDYELHHFHENKYASCTHNIALTRAVPGVRSSHLLPELPERSISAPEQWSEKERPWARHKSL